jgi:probable HAF family extracellular repeat protein
MCQNWYRLRVDLMTLVVVSVTLALSLSVANAGKTPPPPPRPVTYTWKPMPMPAGVTNLTATGMNNHGQVLAWGYLWNSAPRPGQQEVINLFDEIMNDPDLEIFPSAELLNIWPKDTDTGKFTMQWPPGTFEFRFDHAVINDFGQDQPPFAEFGQIAAEFWAWLPNVRDWGHAFRYTPAHMDADGNFKHAQLIDLGVPSVGASTYPAAINARGDVVGRAEGVEMVAVLWLQDPSDLAKVDIDLTFSDALDGLGGRPFGILALGINDLGEVTGNMRVSGIVHAFRFTPTASSRVQDLGVLYAANPNSQGRDINNTGQVAGMSYVTRPKNDYYCRYGTPHAFRYTDGEGMVDLGALTSGGLTSASHINSIGNVIGSARTSYSQQYVPTWFLYTNTAGMLDILKLVGNLPPGANGDNFTVSDINDYAGNFGQICGTFSGVPFILTPDK